MFCKNYPGSMLIETVWVKGYIIKINLTLKNKNPNNKKIKVSINIE